MLYINTVTHQHYRIFEEKYITRFYLNPYVHFQGVEVGIHYYPRGTIDKCPSVRQDQNLLQTPYYLQLYYRHCTGCLPLGLLLSVSSHVYYSCSLFLELLLLHCWILCVVAYVPVVRK